MSKAERRKRSRDRQRERARVAQGAVGEGGAVEGAEGTTLASVAVLDPETGATVAVTQVDLSVSGPGPKPEPDPFITGPILEPRPSSRPPQPGPGLIDEPIIQGDEDEDEDEDEVQDEDEDEDEDDEAEEGEEGEEDDGEEDAEEGDEDDDEEASDEELEEDIDEALLETACGAIEQGDKLSWNEVIACLCKADVVDPRLGLVLALLFTQDAQGQPVPLTGARVLAAMRDLELDDLVEEAIELTELAPDDPADTPDEKELARAQARELSAQAKQELAGPVKVGKPIHASLVRQRQSALGAAVPVPVITRKPVRNNKVSERFRARRSAS